MAGAAATTGATGAVMTTTGGAGAAATGARATGMAATVMAGEAMAEAGAMAVMIVRAGTFRATVGGQAPEVLVR